MPSNLSYVSILNPGYLCLYSRCVDLKNYASPYAGFPTGLTWSEESHETQAPQP